MMDRPRAGGLMYRVTTSDRGEMWISMDHVMRVQQQHDGSSEVVMEDGACLHVTDPTFGEWFGEEWLLAPIEDDPLAQVLLRQAIDEGRATAQAGAGPGLSNGNGREAQGCE